jgi:putative flippase GtrA
MIAGKAPDEGTSTIDLTAWVAEGIAVRRSGLPVRARRFVRYALGSVLATLTSAATFALVYRLGGGPRVASFSAFAAGAVVNFVAGRFWAWSRRTPVGLGRDALSYLALAVGTALAAAAVTSLTDHYARRTPALNAHLAVVVEAAYFATYAAVFLVKFAVLDRVVFRSRTHVDSTTRA